MLSPIEEAIKSRARSFDLQTLSDLLRARFPGRPIRFRSYPSRALRPTAVEDVDFEPGCVIVTLNLGLFSSSSPLPSYFHELLMKPTIGPALGRLLEALDDRLLRDRVESHRPERTPRYMRDPAGVRGAMLRLASPTSPATLHRVVRALFPELVVIVRRSPLTRSMPVDPPRIGYATLGAAALGGAALVPVPGFDVLLDTDESITWNGDPWSHEARRRLRELLFPLLTGCDVHLRVLLIDREGRGRLELRPASALGFEPVARARAPQITILHEGPVAG